MFFRRKSVTLASLDERLSVVEIALQIHREDTSLNKINRARGPLEGALARLQQSIVRDAAAKAPGK